METVDAFEARLSQLSAAEPRELALALMTAEAMVRTLALELQRRDVPKTPLRSAFIAQADEIQPWQP